MLSCYILDDEMHAVELLSEHVIKTPQVRLVGRGNDPLKAIHEIMQDLPDLLFLDMDMPGMSGLEVYKIVKDKTNVIFTTAFPNYAVDAFNFDAHDFLLKPVTYDRFLICIHKVLRKKNSFLQASLPSAQKDFLYVQCSVKGKIIKIQFEDIVYIESLANYIQLHLKSEKHIAYIPLKNILEILPDDQFTRIHKSYIINERQIRSIDGNQVHLKNHVLLTIGATYRGMFFEKLQKDIIKKN